MCKHRVILLGTWITFVILLAATPGFEMRGLAMGLIIGGWPFIFIPVHTLNPLVVGFTMFVLSGATVGICAWCMDKARMSGKIYVLLFVSIIGGAVFLSRDNISYENWKRTPAIAASMESPEVNYQPSRLDFYNQVIVPKALAGCMLGLYIATGICFICSAAILLIRRFLPRQNNPNIVVQIDDAARHD